MTPDQAKELLAQINWSNPWNLAAISGGRASIDPDGNLVLPVGKGYSVEISLDPSDTYTVRRVYKRSGKKWVKGEQQDVYCDQVGEVAYQASCYVNVEFGQEVVA